MSSKFRSSKMASWNSMDSFDGFVSSKRQIKVPPADLWAK